MQDNSFQPNNQPLGTAPAQPYGQPAAPAGQPVPPAQPMGQPYGQPAVPPKKSKTGLIIGIVAALVIIIAVVVVLVVVLGKKDDSSSTDNSSSSSSSSQQSNNNPSSGGNTPAASETHQIAYDGKSFTISNNYADTIRSVKNAGFAMDYVEPKTYKRIDITDVESFLAITAEESEGRIGIHANNEAGYELFSVSANNAKAPNAKTVAEFNSVSLSISFAAKDPYSIDGKQVQNGVTTYDQIKQVFGEADSDGKGEDGPFNFYTVRYGKYGSYNYSFTFGKDDDILQSLSVNFS